LLIDDENIDELNAEIIIQELYRIKKRRFKKRKAVTSKFNKKKKKRTECDVTSNRCLGVVDTY